MERRNAGWLATWFWLGFLEDMGYRKKTSASIKTLHSCYHILSLTFLSLPFPKEIVWLIEFTVEYVTCKTCRSPDTELNKGENRLYFITCNNCASRRSVTAIKTGFSAQIGKRKKMQG